MQSKSRKPDGDYIPDPQGLLGYHPSPIEWEGVKEGQTKIEFTKD